MKKYIFILSICSFFLNGVQLKSQSQGVFSGSLEANGNFFQEDEAIGAFGTPQYDHQLFGSDVWLNLSYSIQGLDVGLRVDMFNNSNLLNPQDSYNAQGIGNWYIRKKVDKLAISVGYIYDQIGSGIIYRAYEERPLLIDNALQGIQLNYELTRDWRVKGFAGKQKNLFDLFGSVVKGASIEGFIQLDSTGFSIAPGIGVVSKTLDDESTSLVVTRMSLYSPEYREEVRYNSYAITLFNTMSIGRFNWYVEGAYKTEENFFDPTYKYINTQGQASIGKEVLSEGNIIYSTLGYAAKGLGITMEVKRTENFGFRLTPLESINQGAINFLPPMSRINTFRLNARYSPATQELGEKAMQLDIRYAPTKKLSFLVNHSRINTLEDELLYREIFTEVLFKYKRKWQLKGGFQWQNYNQNVYEGKPEVDILETFTPYAEFLYKFDRKKSLRIETQYMITAPGFSEYKNRDLGNWLFGLAEFGIAPRWIFTISDMYNIDPYNKTGEAVANHYPTVGIVYNRQGNRFALSYVKQVEGIVCAGGICRLEPAFSGVKMSVRSNF